MTGEDIWYVYDGQAYELYKYHTRGGNIWALGRRDEKDRRWSGMDDWMSSIPRRHQVSKYVSIWYIIMKSMINRRQQVSASYPSCNNKVEDITHI